MNKEEFIGKLQMVYVGDRNAFDEIVEDNQKLKNEVVYSKVEIERLNNIIEFGDKKEEKAQDVFYENDYCEENCNDIYKKCWLKYFEKLQELKENNK